MQSVVDALCMVVLRTLVNACIYMLVWCTAKTACANMHAAIGSACLFGVLLGPACAGLNRSSDLIRHMCRGLMPALSCFTGRRHRIVLVRIHGPWRSIWLLSLRLYVTSPCAVLSQGRRIIQDV